MTATKVPGGNAMTATIPAGLQTARDLVRPEIVAAVDRLSPDVRMVAACHLGSPDGLRRPCAMSGRAFQVGSAEVAARKDSPPTRSTRPSTPCGARSRTRGTASPSV
jgi:hypothetical protein